jgi:hypothetical protein
MWMLLVYKTKLMRHKSRRRALELMDGTMETRRAISTKAFCGDDERRGASHTGRAMAQQLNDTNLAPSLAQLLGVWLNGECTIFEVRHSRRIA